MSGQFFLSQRLNPYFHFIYFFRLRVLSDLEGQLNSQRSELQRLREAHSQSQEGEGNPLEELNTQWEDTQRAVADR